MTKALLRFALVFAAFGVISTVLLTLFSPNLIYVWSECPSLVSKIAYGNGRYVPFVSVWSRHLYLIRSAGDGTLTFSTTSGQLYQSGYLTGAAPSYFLIHIDRRCRPHGGQHYLV